jgi:hypothetical protein
MILCNVGAVGLRLEIEGEIIRPSSSGLKAHPAPDNALQFMRPGDLLMPERALR